MLFSQPADGSGYLENIIKYASDNKPFYLCIYDLSGIHHDNPLLRIPEDNKFHNSEFCSFIKTSNLGFRYCLKCKYLSIHRASNCNQPYISKCYMGITEIVQPVFINNRIASVIYLGNLYDSNAENKMKDKITKRSKMLGLSPEKILEKFNKVCPVDGVAIAEYTEITQVLHQSILFAHSFSIKANMVDASHIAIGGRYWITQAVLDFINANYYMDIRVEHIASLHSMNPNYLRVKFKKESGMSFTDCLNAVRIENAKHMLLNTALSVIDISVKVGFNNVTYFNKVFKGITDKSPTAYRAYS